MKRILIVEDVEDSRELLVQLLEDEYRIVEAANAEEGLRTAINEIPDLVLTDIALPRMNGYELIRTLRKSPQYADRPIVVVTALAMMGDEEKALKAGATAYLTKPVDVDTLLATVERLI